MAYPYLPSGGIFQQAVDQFRRSIPSTVDAATLKKLGIAPSNEGYVINTLKFLGFISDENSRTELGHDVFTTHEDDKFKEKFAKAISENYVDLFEVRGNDAWKLDRDALIAFFRTSDKTSEIVGKRQAIAFTTLAAIAGRRDEDVQVRKPRPRNASTKKGDATSKPTTEKPSAVTKQMKIPSDPTAKVIADEESSKIGLTVRIEINLPANGSQTTYDNIFQSIRKNLFP